MLLTEGSVKVNIVSLNWGMLLPNPGQSLTIVENWRVIYFCCEDYDFNITTTSWHQLAHAANTPRTLYASNNSSLGLPNPKSDVFRQKAKSPKYGFEKTDNGVSNSTSFLCYSFCEI
jgi:hypothetical protein